MSVVDLYKIISDYEFLKVVGKDTQDVIYYGLNISLPEYLLDKSVLKLSYDRTSIIIYV